MSERRASSESGVWFLGALPVHGTGSVRPGVLPQLLRDREHEGLFSEKNLLFSVPRCRQLRGDCFHYIE